MPRKSKSQSDLPIIIFSFDKDIYGRRNKHSHVTHYHCDNPWLSFSFPLSTKQEMNNTIQITLQNLEIELGHCESRMISLTQATGSYRVGARVDKVFIS